MASLKPEHLYILYGTLQTLALLTSNSWKVSKVKVRLVGMMKLVSPDDSDSLLLLNPELVLQTANSTECRQQKAYQLALWTDTSHISPSLSSMIHRSTPCALLDQQCSFDPCHQLLNLLVTS